MADDNIFRTAANSFLGLGISSKSGMPGYVGGRISDVQNPDQFIDLYSFDPPPRAISPNFADESVHGRSQPYRFYTDTPFRSWSLVIHIAASMFQADGGSVEDVAVAVAFMEAFAYPEYNTDASEFGYVGPPHLAHVTLGEFLDSRGYISGVSSQYGPMYYNKKPMMADISFTFDELFERPPSLDDIRTRRFGK